MSSASAQPGPGKANWPVEHARASWAMWLFIATEAMLFVLMFFAYFYLASTQPHWPLEEDPSYLLALVLLGVLLLSSVAAEWGERGIAQGRQGQLRTGLGGALLLALAFVLLQAFEYRHHLKTLHPGDSAYGSVFYIITSLHFAHVLLGMLLLAFVLARALAGHFESSRHGAVSNAVLYWHFVDLVWIVVVVILYLSPRFYGS